MIQRIPLSEIKFHLQITLHQAILGDNSKPPGACPLPEKRRVQSAIRPGASHAPRLSKGETMPEIKIVSDVAGRVCALSFNVGDAVSDGDEIAFVEAMKMEIPVTATANGKIKSVLVQIDDVLTEGQVVAILET